AQPHGKAGLVATFSPCLYRPRRRCSQRPAARAGEETEGGSSMFRKPHTPIAIVALALALAASPAAVLANSGPTLPDNKSGFDHPAPPSMVVKPSYVIGLPDDRANRAAPESMTPPAAAIVIHST